MHYATTFWIANIGQQVIEWRILQNYLSQPLWQIKFSDQNAEQRNLRRSDICPTSKQPTPTIEKNQKIWIEHPKNPLQMAKK